MNKFFAGIVAGCAIAFAGHALAQETLTVWWVKRFYKSEDDALFAAIKKFEDKTKVKVELSQYPVQDMIPKTVSALDAGTPPDVAYADVYDFQVTGKWAFACDKVQPAYRQKSGTRNYATGFPMGVDSSDSFYSFLTFMDAYNVKLVDDSGKLLVDDPKVKQGLIGALTDYTSVYTKGCTPP